ncbi:hypothetical protein E2986_12097 [Frieseomelitta varia]|uniref:Uncharacterized protein n=1 Tax=Frieseomelitta varia TaxID=561572 RepID=A0A833SAR0_9HYME|nr:hypothetical protein E2986_12097 [Frieseomelitta varia]
MKYDANELSHGMDSNENHIDAAATSPVVIVLTDRLTKIVVSSRHFLVLVGGDVAQDFIRGTVGSHSSIDRQQSTLVVVTCNDNRYLQYRMYERRCITLNRSDQSFDTISLFRHSLGISLDECAISPFRHSLGISLDKCAISPFRHSLGISLDECAISPFRHSLGISLDECAIVIHFLKLLLSLDFGNRRVEITRCITLNCIDQSFDTIVDNPKLY